MNLPGRKNHIDLLHPVIIAQQTKYFYPAYVPYAHILSFCARNALSHTKYLIVHVYLFSHTLCSSRTLFTESELFLTGLIIEKPQQNHSAGARYFCIEYARSQKASCRTTNKTRPGFGSQSRGTILPNRILFHVFKYFCGVTIKANSLLLNFFWTVRFTVIQASIDCLPVVSRHLPELNGIGLERFDQRIEPLLLRLFLIQ